jgi:N-acetylglucosaminyldiphosphoundecaprenol N-acetyl-beta-D-mannosaminyltransferase
MTLSQRLSSGSGRSRNYVCIAGVHGVMESRRNQRLRRIIHNDAGMVTPDGMPLVWLLRLLGKRNVDRVYGPDLMRKMTASRACVATGNSTTAVRKVWPTS